MFLKVMFLKVMFLKVMFLKVMFLKVMFLKGMFLKGMFLQGMEDAMEARMQCSQRPAIRPRATDSSAGQDGDNWFTDVTPESWWASGFQG
jgi:hypothetical protein